MNPEARLVTPALQRVVVAALEARFKLETTETHKRDAGLDVARRAADDGTELILAFGGDGLVNEVVNGMVGSGSTLGIIPGGTMNVLARNLGIPTDQVNATDRIISAAEALNRRQLVLQKANGRFFTFSCGCGFDAEAAEFVEQHKRAKKQYGEAFFYGAAFLTFLKSYLKRDPYIRVQAGNVDEMGVMAIALSPGPYAYLLGRPIRLVPSEDEGINVFLLKQMQWWRLPLYGLGALATNRFGSQTASISGLRHAQISSSESFAIHVDGEPLPPVDHVEIEFNAGRVEVLI